MKTNFRPVFILFMCCILSIKGFGQPQSYHLNRQVKNEIVEHIAAALKANYIYLDTALKMSSFIRHQLKAGTYDTIKTPSVFAAALTNDILSVYHDGHLSIDYAPVLSESLNKNNPEAKNAIEERRLKFRKKVNFGFSKAEILPGNIGYIEIGGFFEPDKDAREMAIAALRFVSNSEALIIDLRKNMGGDPRMVTFICNFFFKDKVHLNDLCARKDNSIDSFWTRPDTLLQTLNTIPIYILTSKTTFSAGEELTYDLQAQKRAVVVGENTGGGAHPVQPLDVGHGFVANIPFARAINPITKTDWETTGVTPDIKTSSDKALDVALDKIRGHR
jgi:retinol-binding protein 3